MGGADGCLGLLRRSASGQQGLGQPEARVGGLEPMLKPLQGGGRRLPALWAGWSLQSGQLGLGDEQVTDGVGGVDLWCVAGGEPI
ncbi:MAG: hypothetical protein K0S88_6643 [Actinomycetia bacterium]|nr:hypothetical protein [Actinomycetes bacterium]